VSLFAEVVALSDPAAATPGGLSLGHPGLSDTNGLQVWLLGGEELKALRAHFKQSPGTVLLARPGITIADGSEASLFQGMPVSLNGIINQVGLTFDCFVRVHSTSTDLMACIQLSELATNNTVAPGVSSPVTVVSIQTNLDVAFRLQIPKGQGVFLLNAPPRDSTHKHIGVLLDPPQPKPKS
jgi:hypothetical protein